MAVEVAVLAPCSFINALLNPVSFLFQTNLTVMLKVSRKVKNLTVDY